MSLNVCELGSRSRREKSALLSPFLSILIFPVTPEHNVLLVFNCLKFHETIFSVRKNSILNNKKSLTEKVLKKLNFFDFLKKNENVI